MSAGRAHETSLPLPQAPFKNKACTHVLAMLATSLQGLLPWGLLPPLAAAVPRVLAALPLRGHYVGDAAAAARAPAVASLATSSAAAAAQALQEQPAQQQTFQQPPAARGLRQVRRRRPWRTAPAAANTVRAHRPAADPCDLLPTPVPLALLCPLSSSCRCSRGCWWTRRARC